MCAEVLRSFRGKCLRVSRVLVDPCDRGLEEGQVSARFSRAYGRLEVRDELGVGRPCDPAAVLPRSQPFTLHLEAPWTG